MRAISMAALSVFLMQSLALLALAPTRPFHCVGAALGARASRPLEHTGGGYASACHLRRGPAAHEYQAGGTPAFRVFFGVSGEIAIFS